jgi:antitoxin component of RelBE/YafQ-DinJ toxin-antitoxin module
MPLNQYVVFRCDGDLKRELAKVAAKLGIKESVVSRNGLGLVIMPPRKPSVLAELMERAKKELDEELYRKDK